MDSSPASTPSSSVVQEQVNYKSLLHQYTQRNRLQYPIYETLNEGVAHQPKYRATVLIDGVSYTSSNTFSQCKAAKMDASRIAYFAVMQKMRDQGIHLVLQDRIICKSILYEYADKMKIEKPQYQTTKVHKSFSRCFLVFNYIVYPGPCGRNKKEAEQLAAQTAVLTILESTQDNVILELISSKVKYAGELERTSMPMMQTGDICIQEKQEITDVVKPTAETQSSSTQVVQEQVNYKSLLCEYAQRNRLQDPFYQTLNEGVADQPKFRSTVLIDGVSYTSSNTFAQRKVAKMEASKIAYFAVMQKMRDQGIHLVLQDKIICRSILNEYADKMKIEKPGYQTTQVDNSFRCFLVFNYIVYPGPYGRTKKEAEQLAAQTAVLKILESTQDVVILELISSKIKHDGVLKRTSSPMEKTGHNYILEKQDITDVVKPTAGIQGSSTQEYGLLYAYRHILEEKED